MTRGYEQLRILLQRDEDEYNKTTLQHRPAPPPPACRAQV
jgi:hypothetical protein